MKDLIDTDGKSNRYKLLTNTSNAINDNIDYSSINIDDDYNTIMINKKRHICTNIFCKLCNINEFDEKKEVYKKVAKTAIESSLAIVYCCYFERIIHNPFCNFLFKCGCTWIWKGGWKDCNYHNTEGLPKCPWCCVRQNFAWTTTILLVVMMIISYFMSLYYRHKFSLVSGIVFRWMMPLVSYTISGIICGLVFKVVYRYPYFLMSSFLQSLDQIWNEGVIHIYPFTHEVSTSELATPMNGSSLRVYYSTENPKPAVIQWYS